MDFRGTKLMDYVSVSKIFSESLKKSHNLRLKWHRDYKWLIDSYRHLEEELKKLCDEFTDESMEDESIMDEGPIDNRSCLPFPKYTNQNYGWLASKPEFKLEKFGQLVMKYPNPMANVVTPKGDMPSLSPGRPYYM